MSLDQRDARSRPRVFSLPATHLRWWSLCLAGAFLASLGALFILAAAGQRGGDAFFDNPWLAASALGAGAFGIAAGLASGLAILRSGERSALVFTVLILGVFILLFVLGEIADHD